MITGPSGVGKGTLIRDLRDRVEGLDLSTSATTREPRPGEADGRDYFFLDPDEFARGPTPASSSSTPPTAATATGR